MDPMETELGLLSFSFFLLSHSFFLSDFLSMSSSPLVFSSPSEEITYWKRRATERHQQQQETQQQFEEFQQDSRDLEQELEKQLEGLEAKVKDSTLKLDRANGEIGDLKEKLAKSKDLSRQEVNALEGKLTQLGDNEKKLKAKVRELEQTSDDFERFERYVQQQQLEEVVGWWKRRARWAWRNYDCGD